MGVEPRGDRKSHREADHPGRPEGGDSVQPLIVGAELFFEARQREFWDFITARQRVWHTRFVLKQPWPWTTDRVLLRQHLSNVYRQLDPTSFWIRDRCIDVGRDTRDRVFNVVIHRMISRHETSEQIGFWLVDEFDENTFRDAIAGVVNLTDGGIIVAPYFQPWGKGGTRGRGLPAALARCVAALADSWDTYLDLLLVEEGMLLFQNLQRIRGVGPFIAYQCYQDLEMILPNDGWLNAIAPIISKDVGEAVAVLTGVADDKVQDLEIFKLWLQAPKELAARNFPWYDIGNEQHSQPVPLAMGDIIACLHNYTKYRKYLTNLRTERLTYRPPGTRLRRKR